MIVTKAIDSDLRDILKWLEREYHENEREGFWCNELAIRDHYDEGKLWVLRLDDVAVAFQAGWFIFNVRQDLQHRGLGSVLVQAALERERNNGTNVVYGESLKTAMPFWLKHGFEQYQEVDRSVDRVPIRLILRRPSRRTHVSVSFYPEIALYDETILPAATYELTGLRTDENTILLEQRVIGLCEDGGRDGNCQRDLVIRVTVDEKELCFCKAKYEKAFNIGVFREGNTFYIDEIISSL